MEKKHNGGAPGFLWKNWEEPSGGTDFFIKPDERPLAIIKKNNIIEIVVFYNKNSDRNTVRK